MRPAGLTNPKPHDMADNLAEIISLLLLLYILLDSLLLFTLPLTEPSCAKSVPHFFVNGQQRISPTPEFYGGNKAIIKFPMVSASFG